MQPHGFSVGQNVELIPGRYDGNVPRGAYTALRLLPIGFRCKVHRGL